MEQRLHWWAVPGAMFVLLHVLSWESGGQSANDRTPVDAAASRPAVVIEASGSRIAAMTAPGSALFVTLPPEFAGQRGEMTIWRRIDGVREETPWLSLRPRLRSDGTLPIAGLLAGQYDLELRFPEGGGEFVAVDVQAPGNAELLPVR
jgi:hypothetical protein